MATVVLLKFERASDWADVDGCGLSAYKSYSSSSSSNSWTLIVFDSDFGLIVWASLSDSVSE